MPDTRKYNWRTSPTAQRIVAALQQRPYGVNALAKAAFTGEDHVRRLVRLMRADPEATVRITRWVRGSSGPLTPVYRWEPGIDAPRLSPLTNAQKCSRYRKALRRKHGKDYKHVHAAMKQRRPGLKVVSGGEVIYECR